MVTHSSIPAHSNHSPADLVQSVQKDSIAKNLHWAMILFVVLLAKDPSSYLVGRNNVCRTFCINYFRLFLSADRIRDNGPRYFPRSNRQQILPIPFQGNWYPLQGGAQTWNNGMKLFSVSVSTFLANYFLVQVFRITTTFWLSVALNTDHLKHHLIK